MVMRIKLSKKAILIIFLAGVLIILIALAYFLWIRIKPTEKITSEEEIIKKQLEELQKLPTTLTEVDIQEQLKEIEKEPEVLSEEEINKQLIELNK
jgi:Tfp pilus assembly protein PilO